MASRLHASYSNEICRSIPFLWDNQLAFTFDSEVDAGQQDT